ncbi:hypothetical protein BDB00DRAFT_852731 [Zychaea mexicana]|uniref:uncharacterized protein n=1 Tax=Zychaea mexicana TaxID=64656 RepID=UPI0022FE50AC|nr:uncharacterized protein BDB00DRAFT_852731 [Zychaea mexicana]KAI9484891.1 hypothetical protein BDB00DRAFT_852731 [Zychaea mexicana]
MRFCPSCKDNASSRSSLSNNNNNNNNNNSKSKNSSSSNSNTSSSDNEEGFIEPKFPISQYEFIEGRNFRQLSGASPFLPCDDEESERLQLNYLLFKTVFKKTHFPPIEDDLKRGIRVLTVRIGPGHWVKDMAETYPNSHFTGTDEVIYPISDPPPNCHLRIANAAKGLPFADNTFDYVAQHDTILTYTREEWDKAIAELVRVLKPGGWLQLVETSGILQDVGPNLSIWLMRVTVSLQTRNIHLKFGPKLHEVLEAHSGVTDVTYSHRSIPIGWLGKLGDLGLECLERMFDSMKPRLCDDWSMNLQKYEKMAQAAAKECQEFRSWTNIHYAYCRKKLPNEDE